MSSPIQCARAAASERPVSECPVHFGPRETYWSLIDCICPGLLLFLLSSPVTFLYFPSHMSSSLSLSRTLFCSFFLHSLSLLFCLSCCCCFFLWLPQTHIHTLTIDPAQGARERGQSLVGSSNERQNGQLLACASRLRDREKRNLLNLPNAPPGLFKAAV